MILTRGLNGGTRSTGRTAPLPHCCGCLASLGRPTACPPYCGCCLTGGGPLPAVPLLRVVCLPTM